MKSLASPPSPNRPRPLALGGRVVRGVAFALAGLAALVGVAWLVLQWAILPRIEYWRPAVEQRASQALGVPVRIGAIEVTDAGSPWRWARAVQLRDVVFYRAAPAGSTEPPAEALRLPSVRAALSPASFRPGWDGRWQLRFEQLLIDAPQLDVRRERDGRILVAGLSADRRAAGDDGASADWFFSQAEFAIRNGRVVWTDALRGAEPLVLESVDLIVRNGVRRHAMRLDATPPAALGARFSLRGQFTQPLIGELALPGSGAGLLARPGDWRRWRGTAYAELPAADIEPLRRHVDLPFGLARGAGAVRLWVDLKRGAPFAAVADVALQDVLLSPQADAPALAFARIDGRLHGRLIEGGRFSARAGEPVGGELRAEGLGFTTEDGLAWPATDLGIDWRLGADGAWAGGRLSAARLDLQLLADVAARVPPHLLAGGAWREQVAALAPAGIATDLEARWDGVLPAPHHYSVKGRVTGLQLAAAAAPAERPSASAAGPDAPTPAEGASSAPMNPGRPGVQGADVDFQATEAGGEARLALRDGALEFPGVFEAPRIPFERLDGAIAWRVDAPREGPAGQPAGLEVRARDIRFANADAQGEFEARWLRATEDPGGAAQPVAIAPSVAPPRARGASRGPGTLELTGRLERADLASVPRYLPLGLPAGIRSYLDRALQAGQASAVSIKLRGDLRDFPFGAKGGGPVRPGEFRVAARVDKARFAYLPAAPAGTAVPAAGSPQSAWPAFSDVQGEVVFDRTALELRRLQGRLASVGSGGFEFTQVNGGIRNVSHEAALAIEGSGRGPLGDVLAFASATPVGGWIGGALQQASLPPGPSGAPSRGAPLELQLALDIPLQHAADTQVRGSAVIAGNDLRLRPELPPLTNARARLAFTERSFTLTGGAARLLGGEATFDGGTQADGSLRFTAQGSATAEGLRASDLPVLSRPALAFAGQAPYRVAVGFSRGQTDWQVSSSLAGMAIDLPAPLGKAAEPAQPLRVLSSAAPTAAGAPGAAPRELLRLDVGPDGARVLQAAWLRESGPQGQRVLRGAIGVQDAMPPMQEGVVARVTTPALDIDAWQAALARLRPAGPAVPRTDGLAPAPAAEDDGFLPTAIALRVQQLDIAGRRLNRVAADVQRGSGADAGSWRAEVDATELQGTIEYRPPGTGSARGDDSAGRVTARLARLALPRQESDAVSTLLDEASPTRVPALDITVDDLELNGKRLGRVEIDAVNRPPEPGAAASAPGEWQLNRFRMTTPDAQLSAFGQWGTTQAGASAAARRRAVIDFRLDITDGGALLGRLGQSGVLRGAKGELAGQVSWLGSPMAIDYPSLDGQVRVNVGSGQFLKADPGIAKLLGVLSLQALPRRLLLDFRDVFEQGFAFDTVDGEVDIADGVASTRNLQIKGVQAAVLMEGRADIARETQDLRVWVVPEINAGAASLAVAVINPAVGIGSFLAQLFLRKPLIEAGTREFHVTGPWADPKVDRIERARTEPPGERAGAPPSSASEHPAPLKSPTKEPG